ncbi:MAG TPA: hypothetical protein VFW09_19475 [Solirubrobacteraceae bacterium]|jgi:hypothetical protein|nr:hypothetical protein [Solirubrobacteraceae bacterium]
MIASGDIAHSPLRARYLTDGAHLYRNLGRLDGSQELIGLEDCMSLEVLLVGRDELLDGRVQVVDAGPAHEHALGDGEAEYPERKRLRDL